jgi:hypothetical protein
MSVQLIKYSEYNGPQDIEKKERPVIAIARGDISYKTLREATLKKELVLSSAPDTELFLYNTNIDIFSCIQVLLANSKNKKDITFLIQDKDLDSSFIEKEELPNEEKARAVIILSHEKMPNTQRAKRFKKIANMVEIYFVNPSRSQSTVSGIPCHPVSFINSYLIKVICAAVSGDYFLNVQNGKLVGIDQPLSRQARSDSTTDMPEEKHGAHSEPNAKPVKSKSDPGPKKPTPPKIPPRSQSATEPTLDLSKHVHNLSKEFDPKKEIPETFQTADEEHDSTTETKSKHSLSWRRFKNVVLRQPSSADSEEDVGPLPEGRERRPSLSERLKKKFF